VPSASHGRPLRPNLLGQTSRRSMAPRPQVWAVALLLVIAGCGEDESRLSEVQEPVSAMEGPVVLACSSDGLRVSMNRVAADRDGVPVRLISDVDGASFGFIDDSGRGGKGFDPVPSGMDQKWTMAPGANTVVCNSGADPPRRARLVVEDPHGYWADTELRCSSGPSVVDVLEEPVQPSKAEDAALSAVEHVAGRRIDAEVSWLGYPASKELAAVRGPAIDGSVRFEKTSEGLAPVQVQICG
jgi:hypothetical protein